MQYKSTNQGLLQPAMVKEGDKVLLIEDAYSTFSEARQQTYWNVKVELPDKTHKLAGLMESVCDKFAAAWGEETSDWTGHTAVVSIKTAKNTGNPYIILSPSNEPRVDMAARRKEEFQAGVKVQKEKNAKNPPEKGIEYPTETIDPADIPF